MAADRATIAAWNLVSRLTGFVRVLAVAGALGVTYLGNTYQSANLVSNVLFELLAGGLLTVPLVSVFVRLRESGAGAARADAVAGTLVTVVLVALGTVALAGILAARQVMALLTAGVADPDVRAAQIEHGVVLLRWFLPQLVLYGIGAVATSMLHARRRFAAAAAAPVLNNVVVIATMAVFAATATAGTSGDAVPSLTGGQRALLGAGTTAGVLAMTALPVLALRRAGGSIRPRRPTRSGALADLGRAGAWGALLLAANQGLVAVTLLLANRVEGGVVAYQLAFAFFLLPIALVAHPVFTAAHPRLSEEAAGGRWDTFAAVQADALRTMTSLVVPAGAVLAVGAAPALVALRIGAVDAADAALVGRTVAAYAVGLGGYAAFLLLTRSATAAGRPDVPARAAVGVLVLGTALMVAGSALTGGRDAIVALGLAHSLAWTAGAVGVGVATARVTGAWGPVGRAAGHAVAAGAVAVAAGAAVRAGTGGRSRPEAALEATLAVAAAAAAAGVWLRCAGLLRLPPLRRPIGASR